MSKNKVLSKFMIYDFMIMLGHRLDAPDYFALS